MSLQTGNVERARPDLPDRTRIWVPASSGWARL